MIKQLTLRIGRFAVKNSWKPPKTQGTSSLRNVGLGSAARTECDPDGGGNEHQARASRTKPARQNSEEIKATFKLDRSSSL